MSISVVGYRGGGRGKEWPKLERWWWKICLETYLFGEKGISTLVQKKSVLVRMKYVYSANRTEVVAHTYAF